MKRLAKYVLILGVIFTFGLVSCKKTSETNVSKDSTAAVSEITDNKEIVAEPIQKKLASNDSVYTSNFELPKGYKLFEKIQGDLNGDGLDDAVLIIKGTDEKNLVINRFDKEVDRNKRGVLIYLTNKDTSFLATKNLDCFSSENEDGGVYFPPQLSIEIQNGKLYVHYGHGRYGFWKYTFRYQHADFELIGYDSSSNYGPIVNEETSINFLTKKKLTRKNVNQDTEESGDEVFEETWKDIQIEKLFRLSEIKDFDELEIDSED